MKSKILYIVSAAFLAFGLSACSEDHVSDLKLDGDCMVESFSLDNFEGNISLATRSIEVRLPEVYATSAMKVTDLVLSDGATANFTQGATLNMDEARMLHVQNGDVCLDWTVSVAEIDAQLYRKYGFSKPMIDFVEGRYSYDGTGLEPR